MLFGLRLAGKLVLGEMVVQIGVRIAPEVALVPTSNYSDASAPCQFDIAE
jgi:hypothetical protein